MNLYRVTCVMSSMYSPESCDVYVVGPDETAARQKALTEMQRLDWKYHDRVDVVELIASTTTYAAKYLLIQ